jgi:DnaJ like chaperone protein
VQGPAIDEVLLWLMRATRDVWPGPDAEAWVASFGDALGVDAAGIGRLWAELDAVSGAADLDEARRVLGVAPGATEDEVRAAWRRLVQAWHPDRMQGAEAAEATRRMAEINAAYRVLRES